MIQMQCLQCRAVLAFEDDLAGRSIPCPDCAAKIRVAPGAENDRATVTVRLWAPGSWMLVDAACPIAIDGRRVGEASVKRGFDLVVKIAAGEHKVDIGAVTHLLDVPRPGCYEAEFAYSRSWAKYSPPPLVEYIGREQGDDWPTQRHDAKLIEIRDLAEGEISPDDEAVLAELEQLQQRKAGWGSAILLIVVSLLLYTGAAKAGEFWDSILILLPVIFFHELGHYLTMLAFGYRNLRMFFIPFFGAAVSGQHYNVAGWKKALVALAGPLPGIGLGTAVGVLGLMSHSPKMLEVAMMLLILNGFNLLPFLPLDGGWVVHAVLFVRHPVLDVFFRVVAGLCMLGLAILAQAWLLGLVAVFMLLAAPLAYRLGRIARRLGEEGLVTRSLDGDSIPREGALRILAELRSALPATTPPKQLAQHIADVFERFNAEPPGVLVSLGLLLLHAGSFLAALVMAGVITWAQHQPG